MSQVISNIEKQILWSEYQEAYLRLQKLNIKYKGEPNNELSESYLKVKKEYEGFIFRRQNRTSNGNQKEKREIGNKQESLFDLVKEIFFKEEK